MKDRWLGFGVGRVWVSGIRFRKDLGLKGIGLRKVGLLGFRLMGLEG